MLPYIAYMDPMGTDIPPGAGAILTVVYSCWWHLTSWLNKKQTWEGGEEQEKSLWTKTCY